MSNPLLLLHSPQTSLFQLQFPHLLFRLTAFLEFSRPHLLAKFFSSYVILTTPVISLDSDARIRRRPLQFHPSFNIFSNKLCFSMNYTLLLLGNAPTRLAALSLSPSVFSFLAPQLERKAELCVTSREDFPAPGCFRLMHRTS